MGTIEFEADIKDGVIHLPKKFKQLNNKRVKILAIPLQEHKKFDPKIFHGVANISKREIDRYIDDTRRDWDSFINES